MNCGKCQGTGMKWHDEPVGNAIVSAAYRCSCGCHDKHGVEGPETALKGAISSDHMPTIPKTRERRKTPENGGLLDGIL